MAVKHVLNRGNLLIEFWEKSYRVTINPGLPTAVVTEIQFMGLPLAEGQRRDIADMVTTIYRKGREANADPVMHSHRPDDVALHQAEGILRYDLEAVVDADTMDGFHYHMGNAMEKLLKRLDDTYDNEDNEEWTPEHAYRVRVSTMAGVIATALDQGKQRGLDEATNNLKKLVRGL